MGKKKHTGYMVHGKHYKRIKDVCHDYKISESSIYRKTVAGYTVEEAIDNTLENKQKRLYARYGSVIVDGVKYASLTDACKKLGKSFSTITRRIDNDGLSVQEAFDQYYSKPPITVDGVTYNTLSDACDAYGYTYQTIYMRIHRGGCSVQKAFDMERDKIKHGHIYARRY